MRRQLVGELLLIGVALLGTCGIGAEPPQSAMPAAAAGILAQMDKEIAASKMKAINSLDKVLKDTTKKGDLAGAMEVKEVIDQLKSETQTGQGGRGGVGRVDGKAIAGTWSDGHNNLVLVADGSGGGGGKTFKWQVSGRTVELKWDYGHTYRLTATPEGLTGIRFDGSGRELGEIKLTRVQ